MAASSALFPIDKASEFDTDFNAYKIKIVLAN